MQRLVWNSRATTWKESSTSYQLPGHLSRLLKSWREKNGRKYHWIIIWADKCINITMKMSRIVHRKWITTTGKHISIPVLTTTIRSEAVFGNLLVRALVIPNLKNEWNCWWIGSWVRQVGHFWHQLQSLSRAASRPICSIEDVPKGMKQQLASCVSPVIQSLNEPHTLRTRPDVSHL